MKLGKRASLLILPVLMLGYLLAFAGVYQSQRASLISAERLLVELQLAELADSLGYYGNLARNYLFLFSNSHSFFSLLDAEDEAYRAMAIDGSLEDVIASLGLLDGDLSVEVVNASGAVEYAYHRCQRVPGWAKPSQR